MRFCISVSTRGSGTSSSTSSASASAVFSWIAICAWTFFTIPSRLAVSARSSSMVENSEASSAQASSASGSFCSRDLLDEDPEVDRVLRRDRGGRR